MAFLPSVCHMVEDGPCLITDGKGTLVRREIRPLQMVNIVAINAN